MTNVELRTPAGIRTSFVQQLRLLGWSGRWAYLIISLLLLLAFTKTMHADALLGVPLVVVAGLLGLPLAALWALLVWHGELPDRRSYHWSLPVPQPGHDLARIAGGAVWLLAAYLALAAGGAIVAATSGDWARFASIGPAWTTFFAGPLVLYLVVSPLALWSNSVWLRRVLAAVIVLGIFGAIGQLDVYRRVAEAVFGPGWGLATALMGGFLRQAGLETGPAGERGAAALWFGIGLIATICAATWRPADVARLARRR